MLEEHPIEQPVSGDTPSVYVGPMVKTMDSCCRSSWVRLFSQGADDYLDDDVQEGLLASHIPAEDKAYSGVEHAWDEGFGFFGGAQDYGTWTESRLPIPFGSKW